MANTKLSLSAVIKETQRITGRNIAIIIGIGVVAVVGNLILEMVTTLLKDNNLELMVNLWGLVKWLLQLFGGLFLLKTMLRLSDGETIKLSQWKSLLETNRREVVRYLLVSLIYGLIIFAGIILLIIPGIIWGIKYMFATYVAVDKETRIKEALRQSSELTKGNKWALFGMSLVLMVFNLLGVLLLGIGLIITIPVSAVAGAVAYRHLQGNPEPTSQPIEPVMPPMPPIPPTPSSMTNYQI